MKKFAVAVMDTGNDDLQIEVITADSPIEAVLAHTTVEAWLDAREEAEDPADPPTKDFAALKDYLHYEAEFCVAAKELS